MILGAGVIFIIVFSDDKIYIQEDLNFFKELKCLYVVKKKSREKDILDVEKIIKHYAARENQNIQIWTLKNDDRYRALINGDNIIEFSNKDMLNENVLCKDKIIFYFSVGKTKKEDVKKILDFQRGLEKECLGYVLVE